ncbi:MAG TPA: hypothetical protein VEX38_05330, partial [Fimbriimonadaceae bacterium]|nr:hypothetical protein [Fimbriimonadaceae bacterium]
AILEARPIDEALTEGTLPSDGELLDEEGQGVQFGVIEEELMRAFGNEEIDTNRKSTAEAAPEAETSEPALADDLEEIEEKV